jgi:lipopolysaccharide/colanic/teichoic acid biosynthesis glycosyltransferase
MGATLFADLRRRVQARGAYTGRSSKHGDNLCMEVSAAVRHQSETRFKKNDSAPPPPHVRRQAMRLQDVPGPLHPDIFEHINAINAASPGLNFGVSDIPPAFFPALTSLESRLDPQQAIAFRRFCQWRPHVDRAVLLATAPLTGAIFGAAAAVTWLGRVIRSRGKQLDFGGVVYKQTRVGLHGKHFTIYKLKTMRDGVSGPTHTEKNDPRITPEGKIFRLTKIDELLQLLNVWKGDMSLVGPRPRVPGEIQDALAAHPSFAFTLEVLPGVTSLAQISADHTSSGKDIVEKKLAAEWQQISRPRTAAGYFADYFWTMIKTPLAILAQKGAR